MEENIIFDPDKDNILTEFKVNIKHSDLSVTRDSDGTLKLWSGCTPYKDFNTGNWECQDPMTIDGLISGCVIEIIDKEDNFKDINWQSDVPNDLEIVEGNDEKGFKVFITRDILNSINIWPSYNKPDRSEEWGSWVSKQYGKLTYGGRLDSFPEVKWEDEKPKEYKCFIKK